MPWPDFTELTFGYAYLRELERRHAVGGSFPLAPDFISQNVEAERGYDVEVTLDGAVPLFIQFKRSLVLTRRSAREIQDRTYSGPQVFRMHLHKRGAYRQHKALQRLETGGNEVQYVTSQIYTEREFHTAFAGRSILSQASAHFLPNEIVLPDEVDDHHVSFKAEDAFGYVYSSEPRQFPRKLVNYEAWLWRLRERRRSYKANLQSLEKAVEIMSENLPRRFPVARMSPGQQSSRRPVIVGPMAQILKDKPIEQQASILAYVTLGAQLVFVRDV